MLSARLRRSARRRKSGQAMIILVICLLMVLGIAGLAADGGHIFLNKRQLQNAADAAALAAGQQLASSGVALAAPPVTSNDAAPKSANGFARNNGFTTTLSTACDVSSTSSFTTTWVDTGSCSSPSAATTVVTVHDPPVTAPDGTPVAASCTSTLRFNCFQVVIQYKVRNYIMGVFGFPTTTVTASATVQATPPGPTYASPPAIALYLYEPATAFDVTKPPDRSQLTCAAGTTPGTTTCPTYWTETGSPIISGVDGTIFSPATDTVAMESAGHMVIQGQTTICDPFGGKTCTANKATGTLGFATGTGALYYCQKLNGTAPGGCTTTGQSGLQPLWGNTTPYNAATWSPTVDTSGLPDCSSLDLVLNGGSVLSAANGQPCAPPSSEPYTIIPAKYHSITINHGTYEFESGVFDIVGTAPVNNAGPTSSCTGNSSYNSTGIDHCRETDANDKDLCDNTAKNAKACPSLTAGVWIGHGAGQFGAYVAPTNGSCTGGSAGTGGGGGDQTIISGDAVTFRLESTSGGFVSTNETQVISLAAPGVGAQPKVGNIPLLLDDENSSFMHLDAGSSPPSGSFSQFSGILYEKTAATGGGVELAADLSHNNGAALTGQVFAYSFSTWGTGTAVDFSKGFGSSSPQITTSGNAENSVITTPSPAVTAAVDHSGNAMSGYETFTVNYSDEWALDGYDTYIRVNGGSPVFFSQNEWGPQPASGAALPPQGPSGNTNPNDYTGPPSMAAWPVYPAGGGSVVYNNAAPAGYTAYLNPKTNKYDDWVETLGSGSNTSYVETLGAWTWGHQKDIAGAANGAYAATIKYTFPTPAGSSVSLSVFLTDGDHCGDYATASYSFANIGQPNGGAQTGGSVQLTQ